MSWYRSAEITEEMEDWFNKRTKEHINRVTKYCNKIADYDSSLDDLRDRAEVHDLSKFEDPELIPYMFITWDYKCKDDGVDFELPDGMDDRMNKATEHHIKNNRHHPEFHASQQVGLINRKDRDKPPEKKIDATKMPDLDIAEMLADWFAMSEEKGGNPKDWADKNVNVRWKFTDDQSDFIYRLIDAVWED